ncbi:hypothetical protein ACFL27_26095 [candidate division CSSED10-310 bacterium]|uniref:DUF3108 domain-containing protein n=1 Tax=candidate division CSSED10-310 bacterium TaxID=2855610 RepID=A0ABV6Z5F3_UNCC1
MNKKVPLILWSFFILYLILGSAVGGFAAENYFPLVLNTHYTYKVFFQDNEFLEELVVKDFTKDGIHGYYFAHTDKRKLESMVIADTMFGLGAYSIDDGVLYTLSSSRDKEGKFTLLSMKQKFLPNPIQPGDKTTFKAPFFPGKIVLTIVGFEALRVPAGLYNNCVKIKKEYIGAGGTESEYIWLADNIGMVKWQRKTGRIDELVLVKFPKKNEER